MNGVVLIIRGGNAVGTVSPIWVLVAFMFGAVVGGFVVRGFYQKALKKAETRLATTLGRMSELGEFIKSEILHIPEEDTNPPQKK